MVIGLQRRLHCLRDSDGSEAHGRSLVLARRGAPHQGYEAHGGAVSDRARLSGISTKRLRPGPRSARSPEGPRPLPMWTDAMTWQG